MTDFNRDLYADHHGVTHVIEARKAGQWQFSDGPPGLRGCSADYTDLAEGLRDFAGRPLVFHPDDPDAQQGKSAQFTEEDVEVGLAVKLSCIVTAGLYSGPITKRSVAELVNDFIAVTGDVEDMIDTVEVAYFRHENGTDLIPAINGQ